MKKVLLSVIAIAAITTSFAQLSAGLVGHFPLDGNVTNSGSGTITASTFNTTFGTNGTGAPNKALQFGGTTASYSSIVDNGNLDFTGDFSISFGIYMASNSVNQGFYDNCLNYGGCGVWYFLPDNTLRFNFKNASIGAIAALPVNQWKAVCAVRSGTTMKLYVNGVQVATGTEGTTAISYPYPPVLGQMFYQGTGGNYNPVSNGSKMDELRFYNRALSAAEISALVGISLPLQMGDFSAVKNTTGVSLNWQTLSEQSTAYFDIEKSTNGTDFSAIGKVTAKGNSAIKQYYTYTDNAATAAVNYYRLKLVDADNKFTYSNRIAVKNNDQLMAIELFPNPVSSALQVQLPAKQKETVNLFITDAAGKTVYVKNISLNQGNNATIIPVTHLPAGTYQFTLESKEGKQTKTFTKQ